MDKIKEVYEKFKHFDKSLSDEHQIELGLSDRLIFEMWKAIKYHATTEVCDKCVGEGEIKEDYGMVITWTTCQKCSGEGRVQIEPTLKATDPILTTNIKNQKTIKMED